MHKRPSPHRAAAWWEVMRPFSLTASAVPVAVAVAIAWQGGDLVAARFLPVLLGCLSLQVGTNMVNEFYDFQRGVDTAHTPRASRVLVEDRLPPGTVLAAGRACLGIAPAIALFFLPAVGPGVLALAVLGALAGYWYTAPPLEYKYRALGTPLVFLLMGPILVTGAHYALTGIPSGVAMLASLPIGALVAAILHANDLRDLEDDRCSGVRTLATALGPGPSRLLHVGLVVLPYPLVTALAVAGTLPLTVLAVYATLPLALGASRTVLGGRLARADQVTARVHLTFGLLLALSFLIHPDAWWTIGGR